MRLFGIVAVGIACLTIGGCRSSSTNQRFGLLRSFPTERTSGREGQIAETDSANEMDEPRSNEMTLSLASYSKAESIESPPVDLSFDQPATRRSTVAEAIGFELSASQSTNQAAEQNTKLQTVVPADTSEDSSASDLVKSGKDANRKEQAAKEPDRKNKDKPAAAADIPDQLSATGQMFGSVLNEFEMLALAQNPSLAEQQAIVDSLRGKWIQAGLGPNPSLGFSGQQIFSQGQAEQIGIYAGHKFVRPEKLTASQAVVCREIEVALQKLAAQQQRVLTDVRLRFFEVLIAQRRNEVTEDLVKIAKESLNKTNSLLEAELGTKIDVLRSTVELQETRLQNEAAKNQLSGAWRQLATVVGQPQMPIQQVAGDIQPQLELEQDVLLSRLLQESPEIGAAIAEQHRAHARLHREILEPLPDVDAQSIVQHDNGIRGTDASIQLSIPIPFRNRNQGAIAEARMQLVAAQYAQQRAELSLQDRLAAAWQSYQSALAQVKGFSAEDGILNNSRKTLELIRKAYEAGEIGSLDLITAQRIYSQTSLQYLAALSAYWAARIELEGQLLKGSLQAAP